MTDPVDYRTRSIDRTYYAMEIGIRADGVQVPLDEPSYHRLGEIVAPSDGSCSAEGREIPIV
ncbi:hypothetical protein JO861_18610 [Rhodococcus hoagii]|uniref:hypothetical protein n=1 Tax=Rhodococcus hoagii TaxID=43767 RepID=UPI00196297A8|nr:hypothetical protein [Prescottella equi]MBM9838562.1 hypothetical protein [Prescottella equi]